MSFFVSKSRLPIVPMAIAATKGKPPIELAQQDKIKKAKAAKVTKPAPTAAPKTKWERAKRAVTFGMSEIPVSWHVLRKYMMKVYGLMAVTIVFAMMGLNFVDLEVQNGWIPLLGSIVSLLWTMYDNNTTRRIIAMYLFGFWQGVSLSLLVYVANSLDPSMISAAFAIALVMFVALTIAAFLFYNPDFFVIGANILTITACMLFVCFFLPDYPVVLSLDTALTILFFTVSIVYTSQSMAKGLADGTSDMVRDSLHLTIAFLEMFSLVLTLSAVRNLIERQDRKQGGRKN